LFARAVMQAHKCVQVVSRHLARRYCRNEDGAAEQVEDTVAKTKELYEARLAAPKAEEIEGIMPSLDPKAASDKSFVST
jgi:hypothetical protein